VCPCRRVAEIYIGCDAGGVEITRAQVFRKRRRGGVFDEVDGAAAESAAGEASPDTPRLLFGEIDEDVYLGAAGLEVVAIAGVGFIHEPAKGFEVAGFEGIGGGDGANVFGNDVAAAFKDLGAHLLTPAREVVRRGIAKEFDFRPMAMEERCTLFDFCAARVVLAAGVRMLDHGICDDQTDIRGDRCEPIFEAPAIEEQGVILLATAGDELIHDAGGGADEVVFSALAKLCDTGHGNLGRGEAEYCHHAGDLDGSGGAETGADGYISVESETEGRDLNSLFAQYGEDTERIVTPLMRALCRKATDRISYLFIEVDGTNDDGAVVPRADSGQGGEVNSRRHDKAVGVIGVLANDVDPPGSSKDSWALAKPL